MANTPNVRFEGFSGEWEERKLGEIGKARSGVGFPDTEQGGFSGIPFFKVSDMNTDENQSEMTVANNYVTETQIASHRWSPIEELPAIFFAKVGAAVMLNRKRLCRFPFLLDNNTMAYSLDKDIWDADFAKTLFETVDLTSLVQVGALPSYNSRDIEAIEIYIPKLPEQRRMGAYFKVLDHLIIFHQRKCDETKELKKYMLQKMFPQNGKKIPEIRFSVFSNNWEQRKLNEIAEKVIEKNKKNIYNEPLTNSAEMGIISQKDYFEREVVNEENLNNYYVVRHDDFVYNPRVSVTAPVGPINRNKLGRSGVMSPLYTVFRTHDINTLYLEYYFKTTNWHKFMKLNGDSGARFDRFTISASQFMMMPIPYPGLEEQIKIGEYFDNLDRLITLHQRRHDQLKEVKKFMLQNMFPQKG